ncbi:hypothetical protein BO85DRAFT_40494 [Aspergillus piperis CBS 112811]|uniref:Uncharacterized protein n=1 Tax=Aspergillus piperis CBS 112811 TaxID=1448313 RepID=A0A8G1QZT1_9EURO|nr:hypothetical protein BO85DRAFT_40494 [Aspergillus piperis CBS 112811]RAH56754.1 hypothetical protein BO85DRAFT_40494 [Aspergillus piperis CBS 112811]
MSLQENHGRLQRGLSSSVTSRFRIVEPEEIRFRRRLPGDYDSNFSDEEEQISERGNMSEGTIAVSYVIGSDGTKRVEIHSKPLVEALGRATKDSTRRGPADFFTESEPFPTLFYHIEDIREEIAKSDDEDASLDLKALERVAAEMAPLWHKARAETFESGFVSYDMLWKLFQTEEPVLHEDEIGCLWQFIFIDITYHSAQRQRRRPPKEQCAAFTVWGLKWDNVEQQLKKFSFTRFQNLPVANRLRRYLLSHSDIEASAPLMRLTDPSRKEGDAGGSSSKREHLASITTDLHSRLVVRGITYTTPKSGRG